MQKNVDDMTQNLAKVEELNEKALEMNENADQFRHQATDLKRKMWWKNVMVCDPALVRRARHDRSDAGGRVMCRRTTVWTAC